MFGAWAFASWGFVLYMLNSLSDILTRTWGICVSFILCRWWKDSKAESDLVRAKEHRTRTEKDRFPLRFWNDNKLYSNVTLRSKVALTHMISWWYGTPILCLWTHAWLLVWLTTGVPSGPVNCWENTGPLFLPTTLCVDHAGLFLTSTAHFKWRVKAYGGVHCSLAGPFLLSKLNPPFFKGCWALRDTAC